jgi:hypothetical protein
MPNLTSDSDRIIIGKKVLRRIFTIIRAGVTWQWIQLLIEELHTHL